jgi:PTS system fructose-specific IIC component
MNLGEFTESKLLIPKLLSDRPDSAASELTRRLEATGRIGSASGFLEAVLRREEEMPLLVGENAAIMHARGGDVKSLSLAMGHSSSGIRWGANGQAYVRVVILFSVPVAETARYLALLAGACKLIQDENAFNEILNATQPEAMLEALGRFTFGQPDRPAS